MLDLARVTFLQSVEDINRAADTMSEKYGYAIKVRNEAPDVRINLAE